MRPFAVAALALTAAAATAQGPSPEIGRALFIGERRLQNGGAPCGACHALGGEGWAFTANLGPPLASLAGTDAVALEGLLEDLPFPTMTPLYDGHPLTPEERGHLAAYLAPAVEQGLPTSPWHFEALGAAGAALTFAAIGVAGSRRKRSSRARLLAGATLADGGHR